MRSRGSEESGHLSEILTAFERAVASVTPGSLPALLGALEKLKALTWIRAVEAAGTSPNPGPDAALEELRHATPLQVAELLNLKEAYVHELCRSGRMPATKEGKYWLIPLSGLREWVRRSGHGVDGVPSPRLRSPKPEDTRRSDVSSRLHQTVLRGRVMLSGPKTVRSRRIQVPKRRTVVRRLTPSSTNSVGPMRSTNESEAVPGATARPDGP
jgi:excisionase family DNA binding protein